MLNKIIELVKSVGSDLSKYHQVSDKDVKYKGDIDLVTKYDILIEREITQKLNSYFPEYHVIGEEGDNSLCELSKDKIIYLDPIDGTTNFVHGFPFFAISIGVYSGGIPEHAVVYAPLLDEMYTASKGCGAYLNGKPISVSKVSSLQQSLFATGFPYSLELRKKVMPLFSHMVEITQGIRRAGAASLDLCYLARGVFDIYYEYDLKPWDMAAGILIVQEAGGVVTSVSGEVHNLDRSVLVATNGVLHGDVLSEIAKY